MNKKTVSILTMGVLAGLNSKADNSLRIITLDRLNPSTGYRITIDRPVTDYTLDSVKRLFEQQELQVTSQFNAKNKGLTLTATNNQDAQSLTNFIQEIVGREANVSVVPVDLMARSTQDDWRASRK